MILLQIVMVYPGTHLVINHESQSRTIGPVIYTEFSQYLTKTTVSVIFQFPNALM